MATVVRNGSRRRTDCRTLEPAQPAHPNTAGLVTREMLKEDRQKVLVAIEIEDDPKRKKELESTRSIIDALLSASKVRGVALDFSRVGFGTKVIYKGPRDRNSQTIHILREEDSWRDPYVVKHSIPLVECFYGSKAGSTPECHGILYEIIAVERSPLTFLQEDVVGTT